VNTDTEPDAGDGPEVKTTGTGTLESDRVSESAAGETEPTGEPDIAIQGRRPGNGLRLSALVLVILAAIAAITFGVMWLLASNDDNLTTDRVRDSALQAAETGAVNFTTLDYKNIQQGLDRWKQSATGDLYTQLTSGANTFEQQVQTAKVTTAGKVVDGALVSLEPHTGTAEAIVVVDVTVTPSTGSAATKRLPLDVSLTNTGSENTPVWKLNKLSQISTGGSESSTGTGTGQ
jgi:Mce-associated membrane protein